MSNLKFKIASDGVDPSLVPQRLLPDGARMPAIGLGTFGSDKVSAEAIAEAVKGAASIGYRHFDCAAVYGNESHIGHSLKEITQVIDRDELWITSKLWNDSHGKVLGACENRYEIYSWITLICTLSTGPFPIITTRVWGWTLEIPTPGRISMKNSWRPGMKWKDW